MTGGPIEEEKVENNNQEVSEMVFDPNELLDGESLSPEGTAPTEEDDIEPQAQSEVNTVAY